LGRVTTIGTKKQALPVTVAVATKGTLDVIVDDAYEEDAALVDEESEIVGI
jgi:hypothetical protein